MDAIDPAPRAANGYLPLTKVTPFKSLKAKWLKRTTAVAWLSHNQDMS
jgi:hypothetical protein